MRRIACILIAGLLAWSGLTDQARAQSAWPSRPVTLIVPFVAGGPSDVVARLLEGSLARALSQQVIIENVVGAGGTTAATRAMRAAPDGYTIMLGHMGTHAAATAVYPKLAYDPTTDFAPIGLVVHIPVLIIARRGIPARDLKEFIGYGKAHGGDMVMAHAGLGSISHVACEQFNSILGLNPTLAAFQGSEPAMNALLNGRADYMCDQIVSVVPQAKADAVRAYAVASPTRSRSLPDTPTAAEAGLPEFEVTAWNALFAPKDTPGPIIDQLNAALSSALDDKTVRNGLLELGCEISDRSERSPTVLAALVRHEVAKWKQILRPAEAKN